LFLFERLPENNFDQFNVDTYIHSCFHPFSCRRLLSNSAFLPPAFPRISIHTLIPITVTLLTDCVVSRFPSARSSGLWYSCDPRPLPVPHKVRDQKERRFLFKIMSSTVGS
jgi:hypothetical protein